MRNVAVWYPSGDAQATSSCASDISSKLAMNGRPLTRRGRFPLMVFSHGLSGCGGQSIFFTEALAL
jgi:hypothetical protein